MDAAQPVGSGVRAHGEGRRVMLDAALHVHKYRLVQSHTCILLLILLRGRLLSSLSDRVFGATERSINNARNSSCVVHAHRISQHPCYINQYLDVLFCTKSREGYVGSGCGR